uniref:Uncharacterized protein n=1 Tax=Aegilops tauschii subsp. strangulata TaxID=200361 RepID=A0A453DKV9_AEGTS
MCFPVEQLIIITHQCTYMFHSMKNLSFDHMLICLGRTRTVSLVSLLI